MIQAPSESTQAFIAISQFDTQALRQQFYGDGEFLFIKDFIHDSAVHEICEYLPQLMPHVHRSFIPLQKKGGSVSACDLDLVAPGIGEFYRSAVLLQFIREVTNRRVEICPHDDPHSHALYVYSEAGDHIGYHYDKSFYAGERYTVILGLVDESSCRFEYQLHRRNPGREVEKRSVRIAPGSIAIFNGDKLYHRVTPMSAGERRVVLSLEYITDARMNDMSKLVSRCKDAIAYFGWRNTLKSLRRPK